MKTLKIGLGALIFFALIALTGMNTKSDYNNLKGGESQTELPLAID